MNECTWSEIFVTSLTWLKEASSGGHWECPAIFGIVREIRCLGSLNDGYYVLRAGCYE